MSQNTYQCISKYFPQVIHKIALAFDQQLEDGAHGGQSGAKKSIFYPELHIPICVGESLGLPQRMPQQETPSMGGLLPIVWNHGDPDSTQQYWANFLLTVDLGIK